MTEHTQECTVCKGRGKQDVKVSVHGDGEAGASSFTMDCLWCTAGRMTPGQRAEHEEYCAMWCKCEEHGELEFFEDGEHAGLHKHHYRCSDCDGVVQIG